MDGLEGLRLILIQYFEVVVSQQIDSHPVLLLEVVQVIIDEQWTPVLPVRLGSRIGRARHPSPTSATVRRWYDSRRRVASRVCDVMREERVRVHWSSSCQRIRDLRRDRDV